MLVLRCVRIERCGGRLWWDEESWRRKDVEIDVAMHNISL